MKSSPSSVFAFSGSANAAKLDFCLGGKQVTRIIVIVAIVYLILHGFDPSPLGGLFG